MARACPDARLEHLMTTESSGEELIERYLLARGRRYFRGHHDGEYFFVLSVGNERLHVHLEVCGESLDAVTMRVTPAYTMRVTPAYFFPAADRARLQRSVDKWNTDPGRPNAILIDSCDQNRIGIVAEHTNPIGDLRFEDFAQLTDNSLRSAINLFAEIAPDGPPGPHATRVWLRNAG
jgi:hypothetical protein